MKKEYLFSGFILAAALLMAGCSYDKNYKQVKGGDKFTVMVPPWLKEDQKVRPGAEFQYANHFRNVYAFGVAEDNDSVKTLAMRMTQNIATLSKAPTISKARVDDSMAVVINGLQGIETEFSCQIDGEPIYFSEMELKGNKHFYHLSIWTRGYDRKLKFKNDIDSILHSFREE